MRSILNPLKSHNSLFMRPGSCPVWLGPVLSQCHSASLHPLVHLEHCMLIQTMLFNRERERERERERHARPQSPLSCNGADNNMQSPGWHSPRSARGQDTSGSTQLHCHPSVLAIANPKHHGPGPVDPIRTILHLPKKSQLRTSLEVADEAPRSWGGWGDTVRNQAAGNGGCTPTPPHQTPDTSGNTADSTARLPQPAATVDSAKAAKKQSRHHQHSHLKEATRRKLRRRIRLLSRHNHRHRHLNNHNSHHHVRNNHDRSNPNPSSKAAGNSNTPQGSHPPPIQRCSPLPNRLTPSQQLVASTDHQTRAAQQQAQQPARNRWTRNEPTQQRPQQPQPQQQRRPSGTTASTTPPNVRPPPVPMSESEREWPSSDEHDQPALVQHNHPKGQAHQRTRPPAPPCAQQETAPRRSNLQNFAGCELQPAGRARHLFVPGLNGTPANYRLLVGTRHEKKPPPPITQATKPCLQK